MEELNKMQIVLLTLLVSFVTSIATGIVTVTLMDQAPPGITQTINRIIERTTEVIVPAKNQQAVVYETVVIKEEDFIVEAVEKNSGNVLSIGSLSEEGITYLGVAFAISDDGLIVTDRSRIRKETNLIVVVDDMMLDVEVQEIEHQYLALLKILPDADPEVEPVTFSPITFGEDSTVKIGQTAIALGMNQSVSLRIGTISELLILRGDTEDEVDVLGAIFTTMRLGASYAGGPLLNTSGEVIGISIMGEGTEGSFVLPVGEVQTLLSDYAATLPSEEGID